MKTKKRNIKKTFNLRKEQFDLQYKDLEKRRYEINRSEYFYSLIEHANDKKRIEMIRAEMEMPANSTKRVLIKSKFNKPKINLGNYKTVLREADDYILGENDVIRGIMRKIDSRYQKKQGGQLERDSLIKPFKVSGGLHAYCETDTSVKTKRAPINLMHRSDKNKAYFKWTLNRELYEVLKRASSEEASFLETKGNLYRTIRDSNPFKAKVKEDKKDNQMNATKKSYFHSRHEHFYTSKMLKEFPIISQMKTEESVFRDTKDKLFLKYKLKLPLQEKKRKDSVDNFHSEEESLSEQTSLR